MFKIDFLGNETLKNFVRNLFFFYIESIFFINYITTFIIFETYIK